MENQKDKMNKDFDPEQVIGDNNSVSGEVNLPDEPAVDNEPETEARRTRQILRDADDTRARLNRKKNDVRDYGADARETLL